MDSPESAHEKAAAAQGRTVFVFNGDADGLTGQHILELEIGAPDLRITGRKRDIRLLETVPSEDVGRVFAIDISLKQNLDALPALLDRNVQVTWYDHHEPGDPPAHAGLSLHINQAEDVCSAVIVHAAFGRRHPLWAALAAFGDNLPATARALADAGGASAADAERLRRAGTLINYNAYGERPGDVYIEAVDLALRLAPFRSALDFAADESLLQPLADQLASDQSRFTDLQALLAFPGGAAYLVPDEPFARRYGATWANDRVLENPAEALAVLHARADGGYLVSIRAPRAGAFPAASALAMEFPTGGGRKLAAGINVLLEDQLEKFLGRFREYYGKKNAVG